LSYDYTSKKENVNHLVDHFLTKTLTMFKYEGLPPSIPEDELEKLLQNKGFCFITENDKKELIAFEGSLSGQEKDFYQRPTKIIITNPLFSKTLDLTEGVLFKNDTLSNGVLWLVEKYSSLINETDISMMFGNYNSRIQTLISASDDTTIESAKEYLSKIQEGELGVIAESKLFESLKVSPSSSNSKKDLTDLIELQQYFKATLFNELGLNANYNMKRERLTDDEVQANTDNLRPFIDNMLLEREKAVQELNKKYNLEVKVSFSSVWEENYNQEAEAEEIEEPKDNEEIKGLLHDILNFLTSPEEQEEQEGSV